MRNNAFDTVSTIWMICVIVVSTTTNLTCIGFTIHDSRKIKRNNIRQKLGVVYSDVLLVSMFSTSVVQASGYWVNIAGHFTPIDCKFSVQLPYAMINARLLHIFFLAVHRSMIVRCPAKTSRLNYKRLYSFGACFISWCYGFVSVIPPYFGWSGYRRWKGICTIDWSDDSIKGRSYIGVCFFLSYLLPMCGLLFAYLSISSQRKGHRWGNNKISDTFEADGTFDNCKKTDHENEEKHENRTCKDSDVGWSQDHNGTKVRSYEHFFANRIMNHCRSVQVDGSCRLRNTVNKIGKKKDVENDRNQGHTSLHEIRKGKYKHYRKSCTAMLMVYMIIWFPYAVVSALLCFHIDVPYEAYAICINVTKMATLVDTIVYAGCYKRIPGKKLKSAFSKLLPD